VATSPQPADVWVVVVGVASRREHHRKGRGTWLLATHRSRSSCQDGPRSLTGVGAAGVGGRGAGGRFWGSAVRKITSVNGECPPSPLQNRALLSVGMGKFWITESQDGRVGRDLCGSSSPIPLPKQGHPEQAALDHVQAGLEYLQRMRLHKPSWQPVPVLRQPQSEEVLPQVMSEQER